MQPEEFVQCFERQRDSAILRTPSEEAAGPAMEAAIRGGFRICEFTLTIPGAFDRIREFAKKDVVVGAGTVLSIEDARRAVEAGAQFLVSPVTDEAVIAEAARLGVAMMAGTYTPKEMLEAHRAGAPLQKLFPVPAMGPAYVKACLGPMPFLKIVPTSGVNQENARDFLEAGAFALGFVSPLFVPDDVERGRWEAIEERAKKFLKAVGGGGRG